MPAFDLNANEEEMCVVLQGDNTYDHAFRSSKCNNVRVDVICEVDCNNRTY